MKGYVGNVEPEMLVFSTNVGTPIPPNNVLRRFIFPACIRVLIVVARQRRARQRCPHS